MMVNICSSSFSSSYLVLLIHCEVPPYLHRFRPGPTSRPPDAAVATRAALFLPRPRCGRGRRLEHPVTGAGTETVLIGLQNVGDFTQKNGEFVEALYSILSCFFLCIHFWGRFAGELRCEKTVLNVDVADHHSHPKLGPKLMMF